MSVTTIITLVSSILFVLILAAGFLVGMWRGLRRSSVNVAFAFAGLILAFFISGPITNAILGIKIPFNSSTIPISEVIVNVLKNNADIASLMNASDSFSALVNKLPYALVNSIMFIVVAALVQGIFYSIYRIFVAIFVKKKNKKGQPYKKRKLLGGTVGLVKTFVVMLFIAMPFASLIGTASAVVNITSAVADDSVEAVALVEADENPEGGEATQKYLIDVPPVVREVLGGIQSSPFYVLSNNGFDDVLFDYLSEINVGGEKIKIRQEVDTILDAYQTVDQVMVGDFFNDLSRAKIEQIEVKIENILNSGLYNSVINELAQELIVNHEQYNFLPKEELINNLLDAVAGSEEFQSLGASKYFAEDLRAVIDACKALADSGALNVSGDFKEVLGKLGSEYVEDFKTALNDVFSLNIVNDSGSVLINYGVSKIFDGQEIEIASPITQSQWDNLTDNLVKIAKAFSSLSDEIDLKAFINDRDFEKLLSNQEGNEINLTNTLISLGEIIDAARDVELLKTADGPLVDKILSEGGNVISLPEEGETLYNADGTSVTVTYKSSNNDENFNYAKLMKFLAAPLEIVKEEELYQYISQSSDLTTLFTLLADKCTANPQILQQILIPLYQVGPTHTLLEDSLFKAPAEGEDNVIDLSVLKSAGEIDYQLWDGELETLSNLLQNLKGERLTQALNGNISELIKGFTSEDIDKILPDILYAKTTDGLRGKVFESIAEVFKTLTGDESSAYTIKNYSSVTLDKESPENQGGEVVEILKKMLALDADNGDLKSLDETKLGEFLNAVKANAYRVELSNADESSLTETGLFQTAYKALVDKLIASLKEEYPLAESRIEEIVKPEGSYYGVDFVELLTKTIPELVKGSV